MPTNTIAVPRYLLHQGLLPVGPLILPQPEETTSLAFFAFSDKPMYDRFNAESHTAWTPYPLVKRFLQTHLDSQEIATRLLILDPASATEPLFYAATMQAVLTALRDQLDVVTLTHRLLFKPACEAYCVEPMAPILDATVLNAS